MTTTSLPLSPDALAIARDQFPTVGEFPLVPLETPRNGRPLILAEVVDHEAMAYRAWGTPAGEFLARQMERLAQLVRWTGATTPEEHEARMEVWDEEVRECGTTGATTTARRPGAGRRLASAAAIGMTER